MAMKLLVPTEFWGSFIHILYFFILQLKCLPNLLKTNSTQLKTILCFLLISLFLSSTDLGFLKKDFARGCNCKTSIKKNKKGYKKKHCLQTN